MRVSKAIGCGGEAYYPINDARNGELYAKYKRLAERETQVVFGGRLGVYRYLNMDEVIALDCADHEIKNKW
jgi:UDP-galactopyranose mutase